MKQALAQLREAEWEISVLEKARASARAQAERVTSSHTQSGIRTPGDPHRFDSLAILDDELSRKITALAAAKAAAVKLISGLEDPRFRDILLAYYIDSRTPDGQRKSLDDVSIELAYSLRSVKRIHALALDALAARYPGIVAWLSSADPPRPV